MAIESILGGDVFGKFFLGNTAICGHNPTKVCVTKCSPRSCHHVSHASLCLTFALSHVRACCAMCCLALCCVVPTRVPCLIVSISTLSPLSSLFSLSLLHLLSPNSTLSSISSLSSYSARAFLHLPSLSHLPLLSSIFYLISLPSLRLSLISLLTSLSLFFLQ
jgi:hypothetical protein